MKNWVYYMQQGLKSMWRNTPKKINKKKLDLYSYLVVNLGIRNEKKINKRKGKSYE